MLSGLLVTSSLSGTRAPPGACAVGDPQHDSTVFYNSNYFMGLLSSILFNDKICQGPGREYSLTYSMVDEVEALRCKVTWP